MNSFITQISLKLIIILITLSSSSCIKSSIASKIPKKNNLEQYKHTKIYLPSKKILNIEILYSIEAQSRGVSGIKKNEFPKNKAYLFYYSNVWYRQFWMPNTYVNLDIIFLDKNMKILYISRNMEAHPGMKEPPKIQKTKIVYAQHVLEIRSDSPASKELTVGLRLIFPKDFSLSEIKSNIHLLK